MALSSGSLYKKIVLNWFQDLEDLQDLQDFQIRDGDNMMVNNVMVLNPVRIRRIMDVLLVNG